MRTRGRESYLGTTDHRRIDKSRIAQGDGEGDDDEYSHVVVAGSRARTRHFHLNAGTRR